MKPELKQVEWADYDQGWNDAVRVFEDFLESQSAPQHDLRSEQPDSAESSRACPDASEAIRHKHSDQWPLKFNGECAEFWYSEYIALARQSAPQQEAVAWIADIPGYADHRKVRCIVFSKDDLRHIKDGVTVWTPLYAAPPAQPGPTRHLSIDEQKALNRALTASTKKIEPAAQPDPQR